MLKLPAKKLGYTLLNQPVILKFFRESRLMNNKAFNQKICSKGHVSIHNLFDSVKHNNNSIIRFPKKYKNQVKGLRLRAINMQTNGNDLPPTLKQTPGSRRNTYNSFGVAKTITDFKAGTFALRSYASDRFGRFFCLTFRISTFSPGRI